MKKIMNRPVIALLSAVLIAGCGSKGEGGSSSGSTGPNLKELTKQLAVTVQETGLESKYASISEIGTNVDKDLIGTWKNRAEDVVYSFAENGQVTTEAYGETLTDPYTCLEQNGVKMFALDADVYMYVDDEAAEQSQTVSYMAYKVDGDVLYMAAVESPDGAQTMSQTALQILYKADDAGSIDASRKNNPVSLESFFGSWSGDHSITIGTDGLKTDSGTYALSFDDQGKLTAEKDGEKTAYNFTISRSRRYAVDTHELEKDGYSLLLTYEGADEKDVPNLIDIMEDWKKDYGYSDWRYTATFDLDE